MEEPAGERRNVAVLIADIADSTAIGERLGPERSKFLFDEVVRLMRQEIERFDGTVRSAGLKIVASPSPEIIVAEPDRYLGKVVYDKLVSPRYGKLGEAVYPEQLQPDLMWARLNGPTDES